MNMEGMIKMRLRICIKRLIRTWTAHKTTNIGLSIHIERISTSSTTGIRLGSGDSKDVVY